MPILGSRGEHLQYAGPFTNGLTILKLSKLIFKRLFLVKPFPPESSQTFHFSAPPQTHTFHTQSPDNSEISFLLFFKFFWLANFITTNPHTWSLSTYLNRTILSWSSQLRILKKYSKTWISVKHLSILNSCHWSCQRSSRWWLRFRVAAHQEATPHGYFSGKQVSPRSTTNPIMPLASAVPFTSLLLLSFSDI